MLRTEKTHDKKIALFSGALRLPFLARDSLRARGYDVFVIGLKNFYDPALKPDLVVRLGAGGTAARECRKRGIKNLIFVGALGHPNLSDIRPDLWSVSVLARVLKNQSGYDNMAAAFIDGIESKGFKILAAQDLCPDLVFAPGIQTRARPTAADKKTTERAIAASVAIGAADIGQSVVVDRAVLAVEAAEGTANMLKRVIEIRRGRKNKKPSGVFAKMTKPGQDLRIDIPAIGADTVADVAAANLRGIVVNAGTCFAIDRDQVIAAADRAGIFIVAV
ncbi:MAG: UDP-2,3-diacylglucosamine diphosphatase LpxI [Proteobacteria bacterium]|nr:UDP-2,3-diacylglucosamine diphosphatase LpxI [Pseudomonadota bacterium]